MLVGCGCQCAEDSVSAIPSGVSLAPISESIPSHSQYPNSTGSPAVFPCVACEAKVSAATYRVYIEGMQQQQPTIFGNWGCVEMLQTPYLLYPGAEQQYPWGEPELSRAICSWMTVTQPSGPPAPPFSGYVNPGRFYPLHLANTPGYPCALAPKTFFQLFRFGETYGEPKPLTYQARLKLYFTGINFVDPGLGDPWPVFSSLSVYYKTPVFDSPLFCLNWFTLDWERATGTYERQNPDGGGWESYGVGPGNNTSYEFHRGDFPATIRVRPE
jgi:hypothetical protein